MNKAARHVATRLQYGQEEGGDQALLAEATMNDKLRDPTDLFSLAVRATRKSLAHWCSVHDSPHT